MNFTSRLQTTQWTIFYFGAPIEEKRIKPNKSDKADKGDRKAFEETLAS